MSTAALPAATTGSRWRRFLLEHVPPFVAALVLLPWIIAHGRGWPWHPSMIDFDVYRLAAQDMLAGKDIYQTSTPGWHLRFIYPPIAAILAAPLALGPGTWWRLVWTAGLVWAQQSVLRRCGLPRGWQLGLLGVVVVLAVEPLRTTIGYGQVNTLLMALVVADLLPDRPGETRRIPQGALIGLAAAIKLTPLLFLVFAVLVGRRRVAIRGAASFGLFTLLGFLMMRDETLAFFRNLAGGETGTQSPIYVGNQSWLGAVVRVAHDDGRGVVLPALLAGGVLALAVTWVASRWWRRTPVLSVALVGMATCLASPLSWTHHHVWVLVLLASLLVSEGVGRLATGVAALWVLWVAGAFVLFVMPVGYGREMFYTPAQTLLAGLTPLLTLLLAAALLPGALHRGGAS